MTITASSAGRSTAGPELPLEADVVVCGLGYVGLALAREAAMAGLAVVGYDIDAGIVAGLRAGRSHVTDVHDEDLAIMAASGWVATSDPVSIALAPVVVVCVPTPLTVDATPDLTAVAAATRTIASRVRPGAVVILESTSYPGTTDEVVRPLLEAGSGLTVGTDIHLAFSPERIDPGNTVHTMAKTPKIVSGSTQACADRATEFYGRFAGEVVRARGTREAEMAKLLENTYRFVNISLVNELAIVCHRLEIDVWDVIACASTKPFGFQPFHPGPGVGGHCIAVDPHYLTHAAREVGLVPTLVLAADEVNRAMPGYVASRGAELLRSHARDIVGADVVLLGVTYKADVGDMRMSPALGVARELTALGASVSYHDPYVDEFTLDGTPLSRRTDLDEALREADLTVLLQAHRAYRGDELLAKAALLFDARGLLAGRKRANVQAL